MKKLSENAWLFGSGKCYYFQWILVASKYWKKLSDNFGSRFFCLKVDLKLTTSIFVDPCWRNWRLLPCQRGIIARKHLHIHHTIVNSFSACSENLFLVIMRSYLGKSTKITLNGFNSLKALLISLLGVGLHKHYDNGGSEKLSEKLCKIFRRLVAERMCIW